MDAPSDRSSTAIVIPCFNEEARLRPEPFLELSADARLVLVDDGSTDATLERLRAIAASGPRMDVLALGRNQGKAEAVRRGVISAIDGGAQIVGYADADWATPPSEIARLVRELCAREVHAVTGARVALASNRIQRSALRHYAGRAFATAASLALGVPYYDTQCGAKVFRVSRALRATFAERFQSRWAFDIEILGRLMAGTSLTPALDRSEFFELPLAVWRDVPGSKLSLGAALRTLLEIAAIAIDLALRRRGPRYEPAMLAPIGEGGTSGAGG